MRAAPMSALIDERGATTWQRTRRALQPADPRAARLGSHRRRHRHLRRQLPRVLRDHARRQSRGLVYVPVNWHFTPEELAYVIANSGARVLFAEDQFLDQARAAVARGETPGLRGLRRHPRRRRRALPGLRGAADRPYRREPADQCAGGPMFYTSGTTGRPKGVESSTFKAGRPLAMLEMIGAGCRRC
jgi:long-chain acyl-CoA synthetase